jgi:cell fate regulator YaaT (PSP1 superfamily)
MTQVVGIKFKGMGKVYWFSPGDEKFEKGDMAVVETARGTECGTVETANEMQPDEKIVQPLKSVIRRANKEDLQRVEENKVKEKEAFGICEEKIAKHGIPMKLIDVEYTFDRNKILFYFTADGRVDFRELVKDLACVFRTRIELRQIGVRDEARMLGGLGICGRPFCCKEFMGDFQPVSIKMAKEQGLSLNPVKISGTCGRLMCCLKYEQAAYESLMKSTPKTGAIVETSDGRGIVTESNLISGILKVRLDKNPDAAPGTYKADDVKLVKDGRIVVTKEEEQAIKDIEDT